ncbi:cytochrome P450 sterol C22-desaturase [Gloeophyllum trabeum ATCC 11539]|uniref:Cytochrome P450 sterol C22-desaturase n=1 Tax=Gloeophyllum trabeum (strain ATCC 11539 / FP-39264 / Madison 617) TaxID=670483 RepID=S7QNE2_GLOTA|nr:cytochrome P450 sterol C22-desaturase [Gloeophyllum trabeum ATCC 11539]EPQ61028.1 cytochrome P450 sterol C22-desaturase [Gloeophyllum trabeum ATCC 11539]
MFNTSSSSFVSITSPTDVASSFPSIPIPSFFASSSGSSSWLTTTLTIVVSLLLLEQSVYRYKKRHLPGPKWTIPIIGQFADSLNPTLENYKAQWASGALSAVSVFNIFIVIAATNEYARKIMNSPTFAEPCIVHAAKKILCPENWVFLSGKAHVDYRRGLNGLFTRKALGLYVGVQDTVCREHFAKWLASSAKNPKPEMIMWTARDLNMETSLRVFCGHHIPDHAFKEISDKYWAITAALELVNFPIAIPGTKVYKAIQARKAAMKWLTLSARNSKVAMAEGREPECMLDEWVKELADPSYKGRREFSDHEMAMTLFSFLFASQDAMSSGLIYGFQHLADHPEVLAKVREEQERVRGGDYQKPMTLEMMDEMTYLKAVVKESLRVKPPVTMVPYTALKAFPISEDYTVPAGAMVIPSMYPSLHDESVFPEPEKFLPERWLDPQSPANQNPKNFMVFGSGPHKCIGVEYATMNIALVLANAAVLLNWEHHRTPDSDEVQMIATLFPKDGCLLKFSPRA